MSGRGGELVLAIETSNPSSHEGEGRAGGVGPSVALGARTGGVVELLGEEPLRPTGRHDDDLMPAIARLFERCGRGPRELGLVAVSAGPGGFTGLRVAVVTGAMLAEAAGARACTVPTARAVALLAPEAAGARVVCLASKRGTAHAVLFGASPDAADPGEVLGLLDGAGAARVFAERGARLLVADRFAPAGVVAAAEAAGAAVAPPRFGASAVLSVAAGEDGVDPGLLRPVYAREPEAVRVWKSRQSGEMA